MGNVTSIRDGEYRLLVLAVDNARSVLAIAQSDAIKSRSLETEVKECGAKDTLYRSQYALEHHVVKYGLPKLGQRV